MKNALILSLFLGCSQIIAQHSTCDGTRYVDNVFTEVKVTSDIKYGENVTWGGANKELFLDIYEPMGDTETRRPTIVLGFGGSFISGAKEDLANLCESYAMKGYVAVSIDYRLYDGPLLPLPSEAVMKDVVVKAIGDFKAAVRLLKEDANNSNTYGIDPAFVMSGGVSAGAIAAAHVAMLDSSDPVPNDLLDIITANGGFEGNTSFNNEYSSEVIALVNFSGALNNATLITEGDPAFFSVHDDNDPTVPYGNGSVTIFGFPIAVIEGSARMTEVGDSIGIMNELVTIENSTEHVSYFGDPTSSEMMINQSAIFMENVVCNEIISSTQDLEDIPKITLFPNPSNGVVNIETDSFIGKTVLYNLAGQMIAQYKGNTVLNLHKLENGIYIMKIFDGDAQLIANKRIIINR